MAQSLHIHNQIEGVKIPVNHSYSGIMMKKCCYNFFMSLLNSNINWSKTILQENKK